MGRERHRGGRTAVIQKTHHALVDGVSGVDVARALLDGDTDPQAAAPDGGAWMPGPVPSRPALLAGSLARQASAFGHLLGSAAATARAPARAARTAAGIATASWDGLQPVARCPFNAAVGPRRRYDTFSVDLRDVRAVTREVGCTANDVVLAVVAGGLRRYLAGRGDDVDRRTVRAMCPCRCGDAPNA